MAIFTSTADPFGVLAYLKRVAPGIVDHTTAVSTRQEFGRNSPITIELTLLVDPALLTAPADVRSPTAAEARSDAERWLAMVRDSGWLDTWLNAHNLDPDATPAQVIEAVGRDYQGYSIVATRKPDAHDPSRCPGLVGERRCVRTKGHLSACFATDREATDG